ncbi:hypothetical protein BU073_02880 [Mammaliicoccus vitulinus]|uniref:Uncharacterized protein n=1 Tax=Mammaliicoccus vitulinus TaxID=71237 RepID=A0A2T4PSS4_9STAP|nr:hypothetical protein BU072_08460 [Mammaliicoccus vitulinus]PTI35869.1 hypothetical protein BU074_12010 [Mammaliicoccus vitulinus]PTI72626.1 hypothetical protein BU073_02880 [Mammaliicoccus vitulinus]RIN22531.1 hypothetical protein BU070_08675 [Mammaliicoccus vitulinus]
MKRSFYIFDFYDFESACLPRGMVRACSLSLILFPQASALYKIVRTNLSEIKVTMSQNPLFSICPFF